MRIGDEAGVEWHRDELAALGWLAVPMRERLARLGAGK
jgi:hypothetical protein